jgi:hypothetical protein
MQGSNQKHELMIFYISDSNDYRVSIYRQQTNTVGS